MSTVGEEILGLVVYAAELQDYALRSVILTDRQALQVPLSALSHLAAQGKFSSETAALIGAVSPSFFSEIGGFLGGRVWSNLKNKVRDEPVVKINRFPLPADVLNAAVMRLSYDKIKEIRIKKPMMSTDRVLYFGAGLLRSTGVLFDGRAVEDVKNLIKNTPLATKLKD